MKKMQLGAGLAALFVLLSPLGIHSVKALPLPLPDVQTCDENPPEGYTKTIHASVDGDELTLTVSDRFGGAVESLTWRGKEFINIWDHGRQISYAWGMDGYGECLNPTEPGSGNDYQSPDSTSRLLRVCTPAENALTTTTQPAYWLVPGQSGFCAGGATTAVNDSPVSDHLLEKRIEIGYAGIDNVVVFTAVVTLPESYRSNQLEIPTGYLTYEFDHYWRYNPRTHTLTQPESEPLHAPWSFEHNGLLPPILSTADGEYAMGAYTDEPIINYGIYGTNAPNRSDRTNKWNIVIREEPAPVGTYTYRSFVIVGTLDEVQNAMSELYLLHPVDDDPPTGFIDVATCREIAGWAWDPKSPNQPIDVEFYALEDDNRETLLGGVTASRPRQDLVTALGDNGEHGFSFPATDLIQDNRPRVLLAYAVNSVSGLPARRLYGSGQTLECPEFAPPPTSTAVAFPTGVSSTLEPTLVESTPATEPASAPRFPCPAVLLPLAAALSLGLGHRNPR